MGEVSQHSEYFAFGESFVEEHKNSHNSPYKFNGKELDEESGLYYYGARYYDPRVSLWNATDPLSGYNPIFEDEHYIDGEHNGGVTNSFNHATYGYCYQNPVRLVDPNGKQVDVVDFIPFVGSSRDIYRGCRDGDWVTLGIGVGGLALDCVTFGSGSIAKGLAKGTGKVLMEGGSKFLINGGYKMSKVEMTVAIKELGLDATKKYTAKELTEAGAKFSAKYYRNNLKVFSGLLETAGKDAHHIFPKADKFADFFAKAGIDVNNPKYLKWLEATIHRGKNSAAHLKEWSKVMERFKKADKIPTIQQLQKEAKQIEKVFK
ncbi:RHS repeat-associated core domain-containing protein [Flavobacterium branchiophilum]|uniref:RHS repeat-associated protein n=1 Tax=Flavobacterium branchiophilum TaxID=55197 RepID=A0A543G0I3_9FLAO|nr:RHS repeat-associated core domain-containing protein [Flavobacterium branchiophilum]TQM39583.1 RHS repeat-associated protein [Flavobacterium branchiophilum]